MKVMKPYYWRDARYALSMLSGVGLFLGWNHLSSQTDCTLQSGLSMLWHVLGCTNN